MKLLLDENLSRQIVAALQLRWPGSSQVTLRSLERAADALSAPLLLKMGFVICSKEALLNYEWVTGHEG